MLMLIMVSFKMNTEKNIQKTQISFKNSNLSPIFSTRKKLSTFPNSYPKKDYFPSKHQFQQIPAKSPENSFKTFFVRYFFPHFHQTLVAWIFDDGAGTTQYAMVTCVQTLL
jgi:hypothetical protein